MKEKKKLKQRLSEIEKEIEALTKKRAVIFDEWVELVKRNEREYELNGESNTSLVKKADDLLKSQKDIGRKIMTLISESENLEHMLFFCPKYSDLRSQLMTICTKHKVDFKISNLNDILIIGFHIILKILHTRKSEN